MASRAVTTEHAVQRLVGRKIVGVDLHAFETEVAGAAVRDQKWTYHPTIVLDDGSLLYFRVDETETGEYGLTMFRSEKRKRSAK